MPGKRSEKLKKTPAGAEIRPLRVGTVVFGAILLYIIISLVVYLTSNHVQYYQVTSGPLAKNQIMTGIAVRDEQVITTDISGYVTYYAQGGSRIRKSGMLFGISPNNENAGRKGMSDSARLSVLETIRQFAMNYDGMDYREVGKLKFDVTGRIVSDTPILSDEMQEASFRSRGVYTVGTETITAAPRDGIIVYATDGYESYDVSKIEPEDFNEKNYSMTDLHTTGRVEAGDPVLKLICSEQWSLILPLTSLQTVRLDGVDRIRVRFLKDNVTETANVTILTMGTNTYYARLDFSTGMVRYADERFLDIELVTNTQTGLKIPISSIVSKAFYTVPEAYAAEGGEEGNEIGFLKEERGSDGAANAVFVAATLYEHKDGKYYIDNSRLKEGDVLIMPGSDAERYTIRSTDSLEGVYCTNKGYAMFRKIVILDKNEEYCIVESGTRFGISQYDFIVLNSGEVREQEIMVG